MTSATSATFNVANVAPVASLATFTRPRNVPLKIRISNLLTNASDLNSDTLTFAGVSSSTNGATLNTNAAYILYNIPPGGNVSDSFTYTVSDGHLTATGTVLINLVPDPIGTLSNVVAEGVDADNHPVITFAGIPGYSYSVQRTQDLTGTPVWAGLMTTNAPAGGLFKFTDQSPPGGSAFYRAINQ